MYEELKKYDFVGDFHFSPENNLAKVSNAPSNKSGVYMIYALQGEEMQLIYIGRSGEVKPDGSLFIRKAGMGGLKDRLINGKQFGEPRRHSWRKQMLLEGITGLHVYWYVTHNDDFVDCPRVLENLLLLQHQKTYGRLPRWNNET
jgi:hypothetical protein